MDEGRAELMVERSVVLGVSEQVRGGALQVVLAVTLNAFCILPSFLVGAMSVQIGADLHVDEVVVGLAFSFFWLIASLSAFPLAALAKRWGATRALLVSGLTAGVLCTVAAVSAHSAVMLVVGLAVIGVTPALATPAVNMVIMAAVRPRRRALAFAVASASPVVALMLAGVAGPTLEHLIGWRWVFVAAGVLAALLALTIRTPVDRGRGTAAVAAVAPASVRPLAMMMSGVLAANLAIGAATAFLVVAAPSESVSTTTASWAIAIASGGSIVFRVLLALVVDRRRIDPFPLCIALMFCGAAGYAALAIGGRVGFLLGLGLVLVPGWSWISLLVHGVMSRYRTAVATASGVVQIGYFIGGVLGPAAIGALISVTSYRTSWWVLVGANAVAITALALGGRRLPRFGAE